MDLANLIDGPSAAIVFGGTVLATVLRSGWADCVATVRAMGNLPRRRFDAESARAKLAAQVIEIRQDGVLRAHGAETGDAAIDEANHALLERRSIAALLERHEAHKGRRRQESEVAVRTLAQAAELAPAFGLVGTLVSLSQLPADGLAQGQFVGAIGMAVLTTLYGLISANLIYAPLSRAIERQSEREERDRDRVVDWLAKQVAPAMPVSARVPARDAMPRRAAA